MDKYILFILSVILLSSNVVAISWGGGTTTIGTDTNASTECSGDEVLLGNTSCISISTIIGGTGNVSWNESLANDLYVNIGGDTMTGALDMGSNNVTSTGWFNGLFNWVVNAISGKWLQFDGSQLTFNETFLNETIDLRATGSAGNQSFNQTFTDTQYLRLDTTNDPLTGNLNIGNTNITGGSGATYQRYNSNGTFIICHKCN